MDKPNIMMVLLDSLRADHCGILGYEKPTTPGSSYLAEKGVVYEQAISPGIWTMPSMASLFTGVYPDAHRFVLLGEPLLGKDYSFSYGGRRRSGGFPDFAPC